MDKSKIQEEACADAHFSGWGRKAAEDLLRALSFEIGKYAMKPAASPIAKPADAPQTHSTAL